MLGKKERIYIKLMIKSISTYIIIFNKIEIRERRLRFKIITGCQNHSSILTSRAFMKARRYTTLWSFNHNWWGFQFYSLIFHPELY